MVNISGKYKAFIFDCDGVILDSNQLKTEAFEESLREYPIDYIKQFIEYHKSNGGVSRYEKFKYFLNNISRDYSELIYEKLLHDFKEISIKKLLTCPLCDGIDNFLEKHYNNFNIFMVSGGDDNELNYIFKLRGLIHYFKSIGGSPRKKTDIIQEYFTQGLIESPVVYFGDSILDYEVSKYFGFDFIFVYGYTELSDWENFCSVNHLISIKNFLSLEY